MAWADTGLRIAIAVSQKIRPYVHVAEGIQSEAGPASNEVAVIYLTRGDYSGNRKRIQDLAQDGFDLVAAVGPGAAALVWDVPMAAQKIYAAILDPWSVPGMGGDSCGLSLRIPVADQVNRIARAFPALKKIGLLFDPANNQWFYEAASQAGLLTGIQILPLEISRRSQIAAAVAASASEIDAVWMIPDQTIISEKIVQFVIKEGLYRNIGVIGYNRFFIRSGAVFSFEFDYQNLGRQAGRMLLEYGRDGQCVSQPPVFNTMVNQKIADKIGIKVAP